jgi:hypothetical protein
MSEAGEAKARSAHRRATALADTSAHRIHETFQRGK